MALRDVELVIDDDPLPERVAEFLAESDRRIDAFRNDHVIPGFVPSDYARAYGSLRAAARTGVAPGRAFCEWGSGFGVVACVAEMVGFDAVGIEVESRLVEHARQLASDYQLRARFVRGSFIPDGADAFADTEGEVSWLNPETGSGEAELGLEINDFDVIYAYPWPGEEHVIIRLFEHYAAVGSLLMTYQGQNGVRVQRKLGSKRRR